MTYCINAIFFIEELNKQPIQDYLYILVLGLCTLPQLSYLILIII